MKSITVPLPETLDKLLSAEAKRRKVRKTSLVRRALENYLHFDQTNGISGKPKSAFDALGQFIGSLEGFPVDLSSNKKHMEGFG